MASGVPLDPPLLVVPDDEPPSSPLLDPPPLDVEPPSGAVPAGVHYEDEHSRTVTIVPATKTMDEMEEEEEKRMSPQGSDLNQAHSATNA